MSLSNKLSITDVDVKDKRVLIRVRSFKALSNLCLVTVKALGMLAPRPQDLSLHI